MKQSQPVESTERKRKRKERKESPIRAFGLYWDRSKINWLPTTPVMFGAQIEGADEVDFSNQKGIYILYDSREVIYVGQTINSLGKRLRDHTRDELKTRWNRFSWFGFLGVDDNANLREEKIDISDAIDLANFLEAIFIVSLEPPLNWRKGNRATGIEFVQIEDTDTRTIREITDFLPNLLAMESKKKNQK